MAKSPDQHDPLFVYYLLSTLGETVKGIAGGAATPIVNKSSFENIEVVAPPFPIQRKIAAVLSAYDDLIENNLRRIGILEEMAQAIYREWFVKFRFPGHEGTRMVDSPLGKIPEGWEVRRLGDLAREVRRNVKPTDVSPGTCYFGLEHLPRKSIALSNWDIVDEIQSTKLRFNKGEILFGKIRPYFHKVGVAPVDGICSSDAIVIVPSRDDYFGIVLTCVSSVDFVNHATQTSQGTKMPRANWEILTQYPLMLPTNSILNQFNAIIKDTVELIRNMIFQNQNLRQTRDLLLPKLISGQLDVSDLDIAMGEAS